MHVDLSFPYTSLQEALADNFRKIGGADRAFVLLRAGYKQRMYNKQSRLNKDARIEALERRIASDPQLRSKFADLLEKQVTNVTSKRRSA